MPTLTRRPLALVAALTATALVPAAAAEARPTKTCKSADMRYPFQPGQPNHFGVHDLLVTGGSCKTARSVAKTWMTRFENELDNGRIRFPKRIDGFRFRRLPVHEAQTYRLRGTRGTTAIRFDYVVPNG
jgi:hypothetical protein